MKIKSEAGSRKQEVGSTKLEVEHSGRSIFFTGQH